MFDLNKYQGHERLKTGGKYYKWEGPIASGKYVEYEDDDGTSNVPYNTYDYYDWDYHHINQELDAGEYQIGTTTVGGGQYDTEFMTTNDEFNPTSEQFRTSVKKYGLDEMVSGMSQEFGVELTSADFDEINLKPLEFIEQEQQLGKSAFLRGRAKSAIKTGQTLFDINQQASQAKATSGLESSGSVDYTTKMAKKGVFDEYLLQQDDLADAFARSNIATGKATEAFWDTEEDKFYQQWTEEYDAITD